MPDPTKKKKQTTKGKPHQTSYMPGLPPEIVKQQEAEVKTASSGPRYKQDSKGKYYSNSTPLKQQTMKTPSKMKSASAKAKPSSPMMQKKDMMGKKMTPAKMKKC
jgi:hypothetical protein